MDSGSKNGRTKPNNGNITATHGFSTTTILAVCALLVICLGLSGLAVACGGTEETATTAATASSTTATSAGTVTSSQPATTQATTATTASTSAGPAKVLKIGSIYDSSYPLHVAWQKQLKVLVDDMNANGGLDIGGQKYTLEIVAYDGKRKAEESVSAAQRLINDDKVSVILGDESTPYWLPVAQAAKVLVVSNTQNDAVLTPENTMMIQSGYGDLISATGFGFFMEQNPDVKTVMAAYTDSISGHAEGKKLETMCQVWGLTLKKIIYYPVGTTDFSAYMTSFLDVNADVFTTAGGGISDSQLFKALHQGGYKGKIAMYVAFNVGSGSKVVDPSNFEGMWCPAPATEYPESAGGMNPTAQHLKELYVKAYGQWDFPSAAFLTGFYLVTQAMEKAGTTDAVQLADFLHKGFEWQDSFGDGKLVPRPDKGVTSACDALYAPLMCRVEGGKYVPVEKMTFDKAFAFNAKLYGWK